MLKIGTSTLSSIYQLKNNIFAIKLVWSEKYFFKTFMCLNKYGSIVLTMLLQFRTSAITLHVTEPAAVTAAAATSATALRVTQMTGRITFESFARKFCNN